LLLSSLPLIHASFPFIQRFYPRVNISR
jgi:hypothetical protein